MSVGGTSGVKTADQDIQAICESIREDLESKAGRKFESFGAVSYKSQVVAGTNYFIKINVGNSEHIHVRVYKPLPGQGEATLHSYKADLKAEDDISYF